MTNYICINGNKTELTEEQLRQLGIELPKPGPFARVEDGKKYYCINMFGEVAWRTEYDDSADVDLYDTGNYCADEAIMKQRTLHETLNRLLWRYSMEHDGDKIDWNKGDVAKWCILRDMRNGYFESESNWVMKEPGKVYFYTAEIANDAINEIIKPFMEYHPEFKW